MTQSNLSLNLSVTAVVYVLCVQTPVGEAVCNILAMPSLAQRMSQPLSSGTTSHPRKMSASATTAKKWRPTVGVEKFRPK